MNKMISKLTALGQSLWYDNIERRRLENGDLQAMIARGEIRGVTSNPTIFKNAIANSADYDSALQPMAWAGWNAEQIFWQLAVEDIRSACDLFRALYESADAGDGFVSLEVSPYLAHETRATVEQVRWLWERVDRPNLMVKIPATPQGIPAIRESIAAGVNINVTLIFSLERYREVMEAYFSGLEDRLAAGHTIEHIASVASFFVSRVDTKVDALLPAASPLRGRAAIANTRLAYAAFQETFAGPRWEALQAKGARYQRPLWASTSTKDPAYQDTLYVDALIGQHTVNTVPPQTLEAFKDHGHTRKSISSGIKKAHGDLEALEAQGIAMARVTQELEEEGVQAFADAFTALLETIGSRSAHAAAQLGSLTSRVPKLVARMEAEQVPQRLWDEDASLWSQEAPAQGEIRERLGWLHAPENSQALLPELQSLAAQIHAEGIQRVLVLGMGGSSLAPEVFSYTFAALTPPDGAQPVCLSILDSTDPAQVARAASDYPPVSSLYVVSSKSGSTTEVLAMLEYFWQLSGQDGGRFLAITDPGSPLEAIARERGFRRVILADPQVGGRYSALTAFGLVPAALLGLDAGRLLARASWMKSQARADVPAGRNPGMVLGAVLAGAASAGRDKVTLLADPALATFGAWLEQLLAESSGKQGKGIVPVDREPLDAAIRYSTDRLFVYLRASGELDHQASALRAAAHPVVEIAVPGSYDLGAEFFRWEVAVAIACHLMRVNAFDQPDVEDAKARAKARVAQFRQAGRITEGDFIPLAQAAPALRKFLGEARVGDYIALNAFLPRDPVSITALQDFRAALRRRTGCATTLGFGPRYLHSTGQLHKGGPDTGLFLVVAANPQHDLEIPGEGLTFGTLLRAQAAGDAEALGSKGRRVLPLLLPDPQAVVRLKDIL